MQDHVSPLWIITIKVFRNVWITIHSSSYSVPSWICSCQKWSIYCSFRSLNYSPLQLPLFSAELLFLRGKRKNTPNHPSSRKDHMASQCQTTTSPPRQWPFSLNNHCRQASSAGSHPSLNQSFSMTDIQDRQVGQQVTSPDPVKNQVANRKRLESRVKAA